MIHAVAVGRPTISETTCRRSVKLRAALQELFAGREYARDLDESDWDFAVELPSLKRLEVSKNDLRWLVAKGFVEHALETKSETEDRRIFTHTSILTFCKNTCFVLTDEGAAVVRALWGPQDGSDSEETEPAHQPISPGLPGPPHWDRVRQELLVGSVIIKRFRVPAASQEMILAAFEEEGWPPRIDDPLPCHRDQCPKRRLQQTIRSLNRNRRRPLIRFAGDGGAKGVMWEYCG